jgi:hypothetical protein
MHPGTVPALALATLLAIGGLAAAGDGDSGTSGPSNSSGGNETAPPANGTAPPPSTPPDCSKEATPEGREACKAHFCRDHPDDSRCGAGCDREKTAQARESCVKARYCANNPSDARCARPAKGTGQPAGAVDRLGHIEFTVVGPHHIAAYKVDGQLALDSLILDTGSAGGMTTARSGDALVVGDADTRLRLHDNPVGLIEFKGRDGAAILSFPAGVTITTADHAARIHYPDGRDGLLVAEGASWSGRNATLDGFFTFHIPRGDGPFEEATTGGELRAKLKDAVETGHLGAEVALEDHPANASRAVQVLAYDDLGVHVSLPGGGAPLSVRLSANLTAGRTVALHVDPALVGNVTPDRLALHYYDEHGDGTRTEVVFARADSLADVLDPTNDGGRPEYWAVSDADGLQVLVSVPHWSTHTVTLAGLGAILQPSVLMGLVAGAAGTAVAAVAMFWPRRQR